MDYKYTHDRVFYVNMTAKQGITRKTWKPDETSNDIEEIYEKQKEGMEII